MAKQPYGYGEPFNTSAIGMVFWFLLASSFFYVILLWLIYPFLSESPVAYFVGLEQDWRRSLFGPDLDIWVRRYGDALYDALFIWTGIEQGIISFFMFDAGLGFEGIHRSAQPFIARIIDNTLDYFLLISFRMTLIFAWAPLGIFLITGASMDSMYVLRRRLYEFGDGSVVSSVWARRTINATPPIIFLLWTAPFPIPPLVWPALWLFMIILVVIFIRNTPKRL